MMKKVTNVKTKGWTKRAHKRNSQWGRARRKNESGLNTCFPWLKMIVGLCVLLSQENKNMNNRCKSGKMLNRQYQSNQPQIDAQCQTEVIAKFNHREWLFRVVVNYSKILGRNSLSCQYVVKPILLFCNVVFKTFASENSFALRFSKISSCFAYAGTKLTNSNIATLSTLFSCSFTVIRLLIFCFLVWWLTPQND